MSDLVGHQARRWRCRCRARRAPRRPPRRSGRRDRPRSSARRRRRDARRTSITPSTFWKSTISKTSASGRPSASGLRSTADRAEPDLTRTGDCSALVPAGADEENGLRHASDPDGEEEAHAVPAVNLTAVHPADGQPPCVLDSAGHARLLRTAVDLRADSHAGSGRSASIEPRASARSPMQRAADGSQLSVHFRDYLRPCGRP